jgi:glycosyltransferase involved in cell wall biosynthesis
MAEVSIIVPVYQAEKYIRQCIDSILAQTFTDFELILVDDGSKDNSGKICDEYAAEDKRVSVIHKENGGAASARNSGMDTAKGNYFAFIDGDDYIAPTMLECLYKSICKNDADISACNYRYAFENSGEKDFYTTNKYEVLNGKEIFYKRKNERNYGFWTVVWNKLYKAETFKNVRFRSGKNYEDEFWANDIFQMDIKIVTVPECLYYYRQHENSTMTMKNIRKCFDLIEAFEERINIYLKDEKYYDQAYKVLIYSLEYLNESKKLIKSKEEKEEFIDKQQKTKNIINALKKRKLSKIQKVSLAIIGINPCLVFSAAIKFRGLFERFL